MKITHWPNNSLVMLLSFILIYMEWQKMNRRKIFNICLPIFVFNIILYVYEHKTSWVLCLLFLLTWSWLFRQHLKFTWKKHQGGTLPLLSFLSGRWPVLLCWRVGILNRPLWNLSLFLNKNKMKKRIINREVLRVGFEETDFWVCRHKSLWLTIVWAV